SVRDQEREHRDYRPAHTEALADEIRQPLAGDRAHACAHLLDHEQAGRREEQEPHHLEAVVRADGGIRGDAAGIVAGEASDGPRPHHGEECEDRSAAKARATTDRGGGPDHLAIDRSDLFFQPRGSMSSTTSSTVTVPRSFLRASTTGNPSRSYLAMSAATSSFGVSASTFNTFGSMMSLTFVSGGATTRSRSDSTPSSFPSPSTTYR